MDFSERRHLENKQCEPHLNTGFLLLLTGLTAFWGVVAYIVI